MNSTSTSASMTPQFVFRQLVGRIIGENSTSPFRNKFAFSYFESTLLCTVACSILEHKLFLLGLRIRRLLRPAALLWLPSLFILDLMVFAIVLVFLNLPK